MLNTKIVKSRSNRLKTAYFKRWLIFAFFSALVLSTYQCASIQRPTGGPKDTIPPVVVKETPANLTKRFSAEKIVIEFDEFIKLANEFREISVSPDMPRRPVFKVKRRNLEITMPDSLEENTTYTINFGKGVTDFNEGNPIPNYTYVFSTGDIIDSLSISGNVINAFTKEVEKEITVLLIPVRQDSIFGKQRANIFTTTDTAGNFKLNNLREEAYRIYALKEENNDRIFNSPDEYIGFLADSIYLNKDTSNVNLSIFRPIPEIFRLLDRNIDANGRINLVFNKPLYQPNIEIIQPAALNSNKVVHYKATKDTATVWVENLTFDSLKMVISEAGKIIDTIAMRRGQNDKYDRDFELTNNLSRNKVNRTTHLLLHANTPIHRVDRSKITLLEDSIPRTNYQIARDTTSPFQYILRFNWRAKRDYTIEINEGAFLGPFDEKNKEQNFAFTFDDSNNFGDIVFTVNVPEPGKQYIIELIDEKKTVTYQRITVTESQEIALRKLPAGKYSIRVIYDENKNNRWDTGDLANKIQPERLWYIGSTFIIRANWEQTDTINIPK